MVEWKFFQKHDFDFSKVSLAPVDERNSRSVKVNHNSGNSCEEMMMMVHSNKGVAVSLTSLQLNQNFLISGLEWCNMMRAHVFIYI